MTTKTLAGVLSVIVFLLIVELIRREKLTFKYAFGWLLIAGAGIFFSFSQDLIYQLAEWFGFALPSNFIFFTLMGFFLFLSILLTTFLCQQDMRNDTMAQKIGILEVELSELKEKLSNEKSSKQ